MNTVTFIESITAGQINLYTDHSSIKPSVIWIDLYCQLQCRERTAVKMKPDFSLWRNFHLRKLLLYFCICFPLQVCFPGLVLKVPLYTQPARQKHLHFTIYSHTTTYLQQCASSVSYLTLCVVGQTWVCRTSFACIFYSCTKELHTLWIDTWRYMF